ncbi:L-lactate dehydrogenase [Metaclostridioides mangenotii]|uniref:L-lactate dehydrogenase n=1 Tax=Metaclostridioides mangenotii TaxID=1540 RepID=A0ABS4EAX7_9FIRM|nr:L-lactate dehydrogenase [Clostridioides mangenotii]MBP1855090.1 L-lactate dehydrogenase [Clostridioides mangenotii]
MHVSRRVVLIGTGSVGSSYAFALVNQKLCNELVLIDVNEKKAAADAADLQDGIPSFYTNIHIKKGDYKDCEKADIVCICAGVPQKPGQSRLDLINTNINIAKKITENVIANGFDGIFLIASNPVDIISYAVWKYSGFSRGKVIGSGTTLDTARLRCQLSKKFQVSPQDISANILGEHGDSEFVPWSTVNVAGMKLDKIKSSFNLTDTDMEKIYLQTKNAAYKIIEAKGATYYGIAMALARITKAIVFDEHALLTTSTLLEGEYGYYDVFAGIPCIIGNEGILGTVPEDLTSSELDQFAYSISVLEQNNPLIQGK